MDVPNIAQYFTHLQERVMPHSLGQPVLFDWPDAPLFSWNAPPGLLNRDEAVIVYKCAQQIGGRWLDIGAHTGWGAMHMRFGGAQHVVMVDTMYPIDAFRERTEENLAAGGIKRFTLVPNTSRSYLETERRSFDGVMIDGDHCWMNPEWDAVWSFKRLNERGVIILHDFIGGPVRAAVRYLMIEGMKCRVYCASSQLLAVCWRGDFTPPDYTPDPKIDWQTVLTPLAATKLVGFKDGKAIADPAGTQGVGDFYFELCS